MQQVRSSSVPSTNRSSISGLIMHMDLCDMPSLECQHLCSILDENNVWSDLATYMGYEKNVIKEIRRSSSDPSNSPSEKLISMWRDQNHTVTELFVLLSGMQQYIAMDTIKHLVDVKYHRLIFSGQPDLSALLSKQSISRTPVTEKKNKNDDGCQKTNIVVTPNKNLEANFKSAKILNCPSGMISNENNEDICSTNASSDNFDMKNFNEYASTIPQIDFMELIEATNSWNEKNILGKGGFGTVFKGMWKHTAVAIKKIEYRGTGSVEANKIQMQQSLNELKYLNSCRHDNILPLYGYSINGDEPCLVYQLMNGGSLEQRLFNQATSSSLNWGQRLNIAQGTARGLQYLHTFKEKPLIHGDIKPANILLDPCCQPRIGDFGLAREGPNALNSAMEVSRVYGTKPYLPAEFLGYRSLSTKVDTFSFGVVLYELVTGLRAYDHKRKHKFLTKHILTSYTENVQIEDLIDKSVPIDNEVKKISEVMISLGRICTSEKPEQRPEMVMVLSHLEMK